MSDLLIQNALIWTNDGELIDDGFVIVRDDQIAEVGRMADAPEPSGFEEQLDADGNLILPGFVNTHTHLYSYLARGMALSGVEPYSFRDILEQIWWRLDKALDEESIYYSALVGGFEMLSNGVTTLIDHHASPYAIPGSLRQVKRAIVDYLGMRACLCYEISDRDGEERAEQGIRENLEYFDHVRTSNDDRLSALVGLHASFTISDETFQKLRQALEDQEVGYHIHGAEGVEDPVDATARYRMRTIERLHQLGILGERTIVAHGIHLSEPEKDLLAEADAILVHNPQSNMNNAVGVADILGLLNRDVLVGLGNDGFGSNLLDDLKAAYLIHKLAREDPKVLDMSQAKRIFFHNNYEIVRRLFGIDLGKIRPGYQADLILVDYTAPTPMYDDNFMGHLIFGLASRLNVRTVVINGQVVMRDGKMLGVDVNTAYQQAREVAERLWKRIV
ncbi:MAG: putative aminohydrolase SsnA [Candidatus Bipolaricaulia bacterium]